MAVPVKTDPRRHMRRSGWLNLFSCFSAICRKTLLLSVFVLYFWHCESHTHHLPDCGLITTLCLSTLPCIEHLSIFSLRMCRSAWCTFPNLVPLTWNSSATQNIVVLCRIDLSSDPTGRLSSLLKSNASSGHLRLSLFSQAVAAANKK